MVTSAVESEITSLKTLKDTIDEITEAKKEKQEENKNENSNNQNQPTTSNVPSGKKNSKNQNNNNNNSSTLLTSEIPSTYIKNIDRAFDEANKVNDVLDKSKKLKEDIFYDNVVKPRNNDIVSKTTQNIDELENKLKSGEITARQFQTSLESISEKHDALIRGNDYKNELSSTFENMPSIASKSATHIDELSKKLQDGQITVKSYNSALEKMAKSLNHVDDYADNADDALEKMAQYADQVSNGKATTTSKKDQNGNATLVASYEGQKVTSYYDDATGVITRITQQTEQSTSTVGKFFDGLKSKWSNLAQYLLSFGSFFQISDILQDGFNIINDLDDALTEMNKVSDVPLDILKEYQKDSFDIANNVGTTGLQIQNSTADFLRLGEDFTEAQKSAQAANILLNVSEFDNIDEATESLIAMSSAYQDLDKMEIDDKLNNVGNNFSISTDGLASALQKSASALTTAGNDIDKSIALITAGNAVVQDPDSVGAGIRTIALRLTGTEEAKKELESTGEDTSDFVVQTASKINDSFKAFTSVASNNFKGISLLDENGNNRDTYDVLKDVANIYDEIVETDEKFGTNHMNGLLELAAGKNRSNIAASIIQNKDMLTDAYKTSQNSEGSALEENQKQLDSISGHMDQLKNKWQEVWASTAGRDQVNWFIDRGKDLLGVVDKLGLIPTVATAGLGLKGISNKIQGKQGIFSSLFG